METLAAARRAKRRKLDAPESPEPAQEGEANITTPESSSPPGTGTGGDEPNIKEDPPPGAGAGGEEDDGVDRISRLPDAILGEVISLLPTKDAARTRILATRWRHLWRYAPLNLAVDGGGLLLTVDVVSRILSAHRGPGRRFRFPAQHLQDHPATVDAWLRSPGLDNLQEIDCITTDGFNRPRPLPASTFRFSSSLCVATFSQCHLSDDITEALQFPLLKKLALQHVVVSEDSLHSIIAASPVLEGLLLRSIFGCRCVRINSASLTSIAVRAANGRIVTCLEEFIVEDAPCLKRIVYFRLPRMGTGLRVSVISAPNLETLGCLSYADWGSSRLALGSTIIEPCHIKDFWVINSTTPACAVKILALCISNLCLDVIIDLMRSFPCLEKLYIQSYHDENMNLWHRKHRNLIKGLDIRLKTVVLNKYYQGIKSQVNVATFFVLNAKMLESMTFQCSYSVNDRFLAEQHQLLQLDKRASRRARFFLVLRAVAMSFCTSIMPMICLYVIPLNVLRQGLVHAYPLSSYWLTLYSCLLLNLMKPVLFPMLK